MQKRSHRLLASFLLARSRGFSLRRYELAFLLGSFQPDCNPLTYIKGFQEGRMFRGHNFPNSREYVFSRISRLQSRRRWNLWQYYTLGKLTHYLADAFTYPHNPHYPESLLEHRHYEDALRLELAEELRQRALLPGYRVNDLRQALEQLHQRYMAGQAGPQEDISYIIEATGLMMDACCPAAA